MKAQAADEKALDGDEQGMRPIADPGRSDPDALEIAPQQLLPMEQIGQVAVGRVEVRRVGPKGGDADDQATVGRHDAMQFGQGTGRVVEVLQERAGPDLRGGAVGERESQDVGIEVHPRHPADVEVDKARQDLMAAADVEAEGPRPVLMLDSPPFQGETGGGMASPVRPTSTPSW